MNQSLHFPRFTKDPTHILVKDIETKPIPLWDLKTHETRVEENITQAITNAPTQTPLFLGIDHLPTLLKEWPADKPAIVIEKCQSYFHTFLAGHPDCQSIPPNVHVIVGEYGLATDKLDENFRSFFYFQEITRLTLALARLPDHMFSQMSLYFLPQHEMEEPFYDYLTRAILTLKLSKNFHTSQNALYTQYKSLPKSTHPLFLVRYDHEQDYIKRLTAHILPASKIRFFTMGDYGNPLNYTEIFNQEKLIRSEITRPDFSERVKPYSQKCQDLLVKLAQDKPSFVGWRNLSPIGGLEDLLFSFEMLRRMDIKRYAFFTDWFSQQYSGFEGGFSYHLLSGTDNGPDRFFSFYPYQARLNQPSHRPTHYYPYGYLDQKSLKAKPDFNSSKFKQDVAIIHTVRPPAFKIEAFNELYDCIVTLTPDEPGKAIHRFLEVLRNFLAKAPPPIYHSLLWKQLLGYLDFSFYHQFRTKMIVDIAKHCEGQLTLKVFGSDWEALLPPEICGGLLTHDQIITTYQQSLTTVICTPTHSIKNPPQMALECLSHGGLPYLLEPTLDQKESIGSEYFNSEAFLYYKNPQDLIDQISALKNNPDQRENWLDKTQQWLTSFAQQHRKPVWPQKLESLPVLEPMDYKESITGDTNKDQFLLMATVGILYQLSGYPALALEMWQDLFQSLGIAFFPLALRAFKLAREIKDNQRAKLFFEIAKAYQPDHPELQQVELELS